MNKQQLSEHIAESIKKLGAEETAGVLARSLLGISYASGTSELEFTDQIGSVYIRCTPISDNSKN